MEEKLLIHWKYTDKEWENYVEKEKSNKVEDNIYMGIAIFVFGTIVLMLSRDTSLLTGLFFSIPFAILIPFLRIKLSYRHLKKGVKNPEIKVFTNSLLINNHKIVLFADKRHVRQLSIVDTEDNLQLLEFDVEWSTRNGPTNDEFRIPIPIDKMEEAQNFVKKHQF
ncbi:hypothetical protein GCM10011416_04600 [Polaribacter pacificus]|uniref:Uncharacterized protein n=1 Tax=Polaribacter pacificus TaxID=1775173 RepID=A0A917MB83_9FLAO|nr:hypothetical protein [Polaribacter pacificus]GGG91124.1 hypothetical protein GCM10011416_04600 [Polaribacter pacificus]